MTAGTAPKGTVGRISIVQLRAWTFGLGSKKDDLEEPAIWSLIERQPSTLWNLIGSVDYNGPDDDVSELDRKRDMNTAWREDADAMDVSLPVTVTSGDVTALEPDNHAPATTPAELKPNGTTEVVFVPRVTGWDGEDVEEIEYLGDLVTDCTPTDFPRTGLLDAEGLDDLGLVNDALEVIFSPHITGWAGDDVPEVDYSGEDSVRYDSMDPASVPLPGSNYSLAEDIGLVTEDTQHMAEESASSDRISLQSPTPAIESTHLASSEVPSLPLETEAALQTPTSISPSICADIQSKVLEVPEGVNLVGSTSYSGVEDEDKPINNGANTSSAGEPTLELLSDDGEARDVSSIKPGPSRSGSPVDDSEIGRLCASFSDLRLGALPHGLDRQLTGAVETSSGSLPSADAAGPPISSAETEQSLDHTVDMSLDTEFGIGESSPILNGEC